MRLSDTLLARHGFSHAFVLYSMTNIDACARDPALAYRINVDSQKQVIDDLTRAGIVPVFASSDGVFDGARGPYGEEDRPEPILTYGRHKAEVEAYLHSLRAPWLAVRLSKVLDCTPRSGDVLDGWLGQMERGERIRCADDQVFSPIDVADAVEGMIRLCLGGHRGLYNLCGPKALSRLDLLRLLVEAVSRHRELRPDIEVCSLHDFPFAEMRPLDTSMRPDKLQHALGWKAADMATVCARAAERRYGVEKRSDDWASNRAREPRIVQGADR